METTQGPVEPKALHYAALLCITKLPYGQQTPAEVDKWTLPFGSIIDNPFIEA